MRELTNIEALRANLADLRRSGKQIGLVPTMGNLHAGHLSLVDIARDNADIVVVTIFVNPIQFVEGEDFEHYPRTPQRDAELLQQHNVDIVFSPAVEDIYPAHSVLMTEVTVPELESDYCGYYRPGHFKGVATVVTKLLNIVQPDVAVFGEKDYQQLLVIRQLVSDLNMPVRIIGGPIVREANGLAMSSRNQYLNDQEREQAAGLYQCLCRIAQSIAEGNRDYMALETQAMQELEGLGFRPEYVGICDAKTLKSPLHDNLVIIAAAWLGRARLIDNVAVQN